MSDLFLGGNRPEKFYAGNVAVKKMYKNGALTWAPHWSPAALNTELELWLDATDAATITLNGSAISGWADKSANGHSLVQPTAANQPSTLGANGTALIKTRAAVNFTAQHFLSAAAVVLSPPFTVSCIIELNGPDAAIRYLFDSYNSAIRTRGRYSLANADTLEFVTAGVNDNFGGPETISATNLATGQEAHVLVFHHAGLSGTSTIHKDGALIASGQLGSENLAGLTLGNQREYAVGINTTSMSLSGRMGEFLITSGSASQTTREKVEGYLAHNWRLTDSLPAAHPYKTNFPLDV